MVNSFRIVWSCSLGVCFQKKMCSGGTTVSLSQFAVARRIDDLSKNIELFFEAENKQMFRF